MKHEYENYEIYNTAHSPTGELVKYRRRKCKCGHVLNFLTRNVATCTHCGRLVYPDEKMEFLDKLKKELKK